MPFESLIRNASDNTKVWQYICYLLIALFCCDIVTFCMIFIVMSGSLTIHSYVILSRGHLKCNIACYNYEILHDDMSIFDVANFGLLSLFVLSLFFIMCTIPFLFLFTTLLRLCAAAKKYSFEGIRGVMRRCKKLYTLHYIHRHTRDIIILLDQYFSFYIDYSLLIITLYNVHNLLILRLIILLTMYMLHDNGTYLANFFSRRYCVCCFLPFCDSWLVLCVTFNISK